MILTVTHQSRTGGGSLFLHVADTLAHPSHRSLICAQAAVELVLDVGVSHSIEESVDRADAAKLRRRRLRERARDPAHETGAKAGSTAGKLRIVDQFQAFDYLLCDALGF